MTAKPGQAATTGDLGKLAGATQAGLDGLDGKLGNLQTQSPVKYTDTNGKPVAYDPKTGNYYPAKDDGTANTSATPVATGDIVARLGNKEPVKFGNIASSIPDTKEATNPKAFVDNLSTAATSTPNAAVNVSDLNRLAITPLTFAGDTGNNFDRKLGQTTNIVGGVTTADNLTDNNIGVVSNGSNKLTVKLAKDIDLGADGSLAIGDATGEVVIDNTGIIQSDLFGNIKQSTPESTVHSNSKGDTNTMTAEGLLVENPSGSQTNYTADGIKFSTNDNGSNKPLTGSPILNKVGLSFSNDVGEKDTSAPSIQASGIDGGGKGIDNIASGLNASNHTLDGIIKDNANNKKAVNAADLAVIAGAANQEIANKNKEIANTISIVSTQLSGQIGEVDNRLSREINKVREVLGGNGNHIGTEQVTINNNGKEQKANAAVSVEKIINDDGTTTEVKHTLKTYNVEGQTEYITNNVIEAISKMNQQGIKFFHTNDGKVKPVAQSSNNEDSSASGSYATAVGYQAKASGTNAIAFGKGSQATAENSIAVGTGNIVDAAKSGAFGDPNYINGKDVNNVAVSGSYAIGNDNVINSSNTFVLGNEVNNKGTVTDGKPDAVGSTVENSVYLGNKTTATAGNQAGTRNLKQNGDAGQTTTAGDKGVVNGAIAGGTIYNGFAGAAADGVVSVSASGNERRIQNVAAGEVSRTSTDAVNGSQLHSVADKLGRNTAQLSAGIASSAAIENAPYVPGKWTYAAGASHFNNESAVGISLRRTADNGRWSINGGVSTNTQSAPLFRIGVSGVIN